MKFKILMLSSVLLASTACNDLNLNPLSEAMSDNWYSDETEIEMSLNDAYRLIFWSFESYSPDFLGNAWSDDWMRRDETMYITNGTINGETASVKEQWSYIYKAIARANTILKKTEDKKDIPEGTLNKYRADARFVRASQYSRLISYWGNVPFYTSTLNIDEAFAMGKTGKDTILTQIYADYDFAAEHLPESYASTEPAHATKGAALAMKARIALYNGDYEIARDAASDCMKLGLYSLYPNFGGYFLTTTKNAPETIFAIPRSIGFGVYFDKWYCTSMTSRLAGGYATQAPSWELFCSFLCKDGLPIDESPLFNPRKPFDNRDPRCAATIVKFSTEYLGFTFQPHPDSTKVYKYSTGNLCNQQRQQNNSKYLCILQRIASSEKVLTEISVMKTNVQTLISSSPVMPMSC